MHNTKNSLPLDVRKKVIDVLALRLADGIDLFCQTKQAHWTVKGMSFISLHELFDSIAEMLEEHVDTIAERIMQLGGVTEGTVKKVAEKTTLPDYPTTISTGHDHVEQLSTVLAKFAGLCRDAIDETDKFGDQVTSDMFTTIAGELDKQVWFVEAHIQK